MLFKDSSVTEAYKRTRRWYVGLSAVLFLIHLAGVRAPSPGEWHDITLLTIDLGEATRPMWAYYGAWATLVWLTYLYSTLWKVRNQEGLRQFIETDILPNKVMKIGFPIVTEAGGSTNSEKEVRLVKPLHENDMLGEWEWNVFVFEDGEEKSNSHGRIDKSKVLLANRQAMTDYRWKYPHFWELTFPFVMAALAVMMAVVDWLVLPYLISVI